MHNKLIWKGYLINTNFVNLFSKISEFWETRKKKILKKKMQGKERDAIKLNYVIPTKYSKIKSNSLF